LVIEGNSRLAGFREFCKDQPSFFSFNSANEQWAIDCIARYPKGREASAIIPMLWRAQMQEGWLSQAAIAHVCDRLSIPHMRGLEVASFYTMFHLSPVGTVAHIQVCGTTCCMLSGSDELIAVCREIIASESGGVSEDGRYSWEEVECLGACSNAPVLQIGKDYYEDMSADSLRDILQKLDKGQDVMPGSAIGRFSSEPCGMKPLGIESNDEVSRLETRNACVHLFVRDRRGDE